VVWAAVVDGEAGFVAVVVIPAAAAEEATESNFPVLALGRAWECNPAYPVVLAGCNLKRGYFG
jgi:hypothetical protein